MIAAHPPMVGISPRCMLTAVPLSAALWAIILTTLAPAPAASILLAPVKDARHG